nr:9049_t:CDS:2 [Entrophospora candida]
MSSRSLTLHIETAIQRFKDTHKFFQKDANTGDKKDVNTGNKINIAQSNTNDSLDDKNDEFMLYKMTVRTYEEPIVSSKPDAHLESETIQYDMVGMFVMADFYQLSNG